MFDEKGVAMNAPTTVSVNNVKLFSLKDPSAFQYLWLGLYTSLIGNHLVKIGLIWYVNEKFIGTGGATALIISNTLPVALVAIFAGVLADSFNKKFLLYLGDLSQAFIMFLMFVLFTNIELSIIHIAVLSGISSLFSILYNPVSQTIISDLSGSNQEITIKMNSWILSTNSVLGVVGPAIGGLIITFLPINIILLINSITFVISALMTFFMDHKWKKEGVIITTPSLKSRNFFLEAKKGFGSIVPYSWISRCDN
ncbi:MFS transporter [Peribacillus sp. NPDC097675]|uniref:MFS transporter n=1 Tax=Peribacillus sp. NPDC097675 TaxID=3390618 RepID=UPI003D002ACC